MKQISKFWRLSLLRFLFLVIDANFLKEMSAICIAVIGKDNAPLYIATADEDKDLDLHYSVHASLDVVQEKCQPQSKSSPDSKELYLGLLDSSETYRIYGFVTNTKIKFIIVVDSENVALRENEVRAMFRSLQITYTDAICNPFYLPGEPLTSKKFDQAVKKIMHGGS